MYEVGSGMPACHSVLLVSHDTLQEVAETLVGSMILRDKFHYIPPFLKRLQSLVNSNVDLGQFKASLLNLQYDCAFVDPTHIVAEYHNPWWIASMPIADDISPLDGIPEFLRQVSSCL